MIETNLRVSLREPVLLLDRQTGLEIWGETVDVSRGGMCVDARTPFEVGTPLSVRMRGPAEKPFETEVYVVRTFGDGLAVRFDNPPPEEAARLDLFLQKKLVGEPSAAERLEKLQGIVERVNSGLELREILDHVYTSFRPIIPFERLGLALIKSEGRKLEAVWARSELKVSALPAGYSAPLNGSSLQTILRTGKPRILNDLHEYLRDHPQSDSTRRIAADGMRSSLTCPLVADGKPIGFLFFSSVESHRYERAHVQAFLDLARQISLAVERGLLFDETVKTKKRLEVTNRKLRTLSHTDRLTGIRNRRYFDHRLDLEWRRAVRSKRPLSLILIDVDHFKAFNDLYGHPEGDRCLTAIAQALAGMLHRPDEFVARYGGEEFAVLLPDTGKAGAIRTAGLLRKAVDQLNITHAGSSVSPFVTISLGVASLRGVKGKNAEELTAAADRELYTAKRSGRHRASVTL